MPVSSIAASHAAQINSSAKNAAQPATADFAALLASGKKPNVAQFMAATGASAKEASTIIYQHKDWTLYLQDIATPSLLEAQEQLKEEVASGLREKSWYGATGADGSAEFSWRRPPEPELPGKIVPHYHEDGRLIGLGLIDGNGQKQTMSGAGNKAGFERLALGVDVGQAGLDEFAQRLGAPDFASLDFAELRDIMPSKEEWVERFGQEELW